MAEEAIHLNDDLEIGRGSERVVYRHPREESLCIKVRYRVRRSRDESVREFEFRKFLAQRYDLDKIPFALPSGWVETSLGKGLLCPLIKNDCGAVSPKLGLVEKTDNLTVLIDEFCDKLLSMKLSVTDLRKQNLVLQTTGGKSEVVMVDGFGFTNDFLKALYRVTPAITVSQTRRRIDKFKLTL